jgi:octaprenyl-diphosphate synthase
MAMSTYSGSAIDTASTLGVEPSRRGVMESLVGVARKAGVDPLAVKLVAIRRWLARDLAALDDAIGALDGAGEAEATSEAEAERAHHDSLAVRASRYLLERPGKRVRPLCVILAARLGGRAMDGPVRDVAVASELVHAATLLHDDVIDQGDERRGAPTARVIFGNSVSVLAGDHLLVEALKRVAGAGEPALMAGLLDTISGMVDAEALQLERRGQFDPDRAAYLSVVQGKTAALFRWGLCAGGRLGGLDEGAIGALAQCGEALGLAFQLVDDCLDLTGDPADTGKDVLRDLREGKITWPLILAAEHDPRIGDAIAAGLREGEGEISEEIARRVLGRVQDTGAIAATRVYAARQVEVARRALETLPRSRARGAIEAVLHSVVNRTK